MFKTWYEVFNFSFSFCNDKISFCNEIIEESFLLIVSVSSSTEIVVGVNGEDGEENMNFSSFNSKIYLIENSENNSQRIF